MMATNGCPEVVLCSSSHDGPSTETPGFSSLNATALRERRQRKKLRFKKLEKRLEVLDRQIKKCAEAEVSLDEMKSGYSAYIKEDVLKRKFVKTWQELCRLQHVSDSIEIEDREGSCYEGTPYPEVNRRVQRLLRLDEFPDYLDVVQLVERCNSKHSLGIGAEKKGQLARKIFKDVGKIMKRSRHRDFVHHFGSHLTDSFFPASDPAEQDEALQKRLHESQREGEKMMEAVVEEFVARQEQLQETSGQQSLEGDSCSANEEEEEEEEEEKEEEEEEEKEGGAQLGEDESGSEMDMALQNQDPLHSTKTDEKEGEKEGEEVEFEVCSEQDPVMADSTTTCRSESPTSTQLKQDSAEPGPSGLASSAVDEDATAAASSHITSTSDVVCLDDDEDDDVIIVLSDSDPTT